MIRRLIFIVNFLSVLGLLLAYLSPYVPPQKWYIPQLFGLFYPYLLVINIGFAIFWLFFKRNYALYFFLVILVGFGFISRVYKWNEKTVSESDETIKLLTYNVKRFGTASDGKTTEPKALFEFVTEQNANIACFQEYSHPRYQKYGKKILENHYKYTHNDGEIATFSQFPIIKKQHIDFEKDHYASGIITDIVADMDTLRIVNVHLESNRLSPENKKDLEEVVNKKRNFSKLRTLASKLKRASYNREKQVDILTTIVKDSPYAVILCGDFNDVPLSYSYQRIKKLLNDSFVESGENMGQTFSEGVINVRIDYVFSNKTFYNHQVYSVEYSDHKPVTVLIKRNLE